MTGPSLPYQSSSATSKAAAVGAEGAVRSWLEIVASYFEVEGARGATDEEAQEFLGLNPSTERPRRVELVKRGVLQDSGRTRPTRSGRAATVWVWAKEA